MLITKFIGWQEIHCNLIVKLVQMGFIEQWNKYLFVATDLGNAVIRDESILCCYLNNNAETSE